MCVCVYLLLFQAAVNWQTHVWSISAASLASHCSTCEAVKVSPARRVRPSSPSCRSTRSTAYQMKNWSRGYPKHPPLLTAEVIRGSKARELILMWICVTQRTQTGREVHMQHVKGGVGSKLGVLTHLTGVGERGCQSWSNVSCSVI